MSELITLFVNGASVTVPGILRYFRRLTRYEFRFIRYSFRGKSIFYGPFRSLTDYSRLELSVTSLRKTMGESPFHRFAPAQADFPPPNGDAGRTLMVLRHETS